MKKLISFALILNSNLITTQEGVEDEFETKVNVKKVFEKLDSKN